MMTNDGSDKHEELGSARFSYLVATYELRDAKLALGRATIDAAREAHAKAWIAFDALA